MPVHAADSYRRASCLQPLQGPVLERALEYLTIEEVVCIYQQFQSSAWRPNCQVLWSGMLREVAQQWADQNGLQTLTTAMGPLMDLKHPSCSKDKISSNYVKGASVLFAWHISRGERVVVLTPPPPERFHPSGLTNWQAIEEPILKGDLGNRPILQIELVHPSVKTAEAFSYQIWPNDQTRIWNATFGKLPTEKPHWRTVKNFKPLGAGALHQNASQVIVERQLIGAAPRGAPKRNPAPITNTTIQKPKEAPAVPASPQRKILKATVLKSNTTKKKPSKEQFPKKKSKNQASKKQSEKEVFEGPSKVMKATKEAKGGLPKHTPKREIIRSKKSKATISEGGASMSKSKGEVLAQVSKKTSRMTSKKSVEKASTNVLKAMSKAKKLDNTASRKSPKKNPSRSLDPQRKMKGEAPGTNMIKAMKVKQVKKTSRKIPQEKQGSKR